MAVSQHSKLHKLFPLLSYEERGGRFPDEKKEICRRAAELVAEDDTIYIDTGTTCLNLVDFIADKHCTILTNSLLIFNKAASIRTWISFSVPGLNRKTPVLHRTGYQ